MDRKLDELRDLIKDTQNAQFYRKKLKASFPYTEKILHKVFPTFFSNPDLD